MKKSDELEKNAAIRIAELMACCARTSPKTRGIDNIEAVLIDSPTERDKLICKMKEISKTESRPSFERDANSIGSSPAILIIGVKANPAGLNCGFCGFPTCEELRKNKGICSFNSVDLGIAATSAIETASRLHADNRIMYSIGRAALDLRLFTSEVKQALGIPLSITGKNPFFDRK